MEINIGTWYTLEMQTEGIPASTQEDVKQYIASSGLPPLPKWWDWVKDTTKASSSKGWAGSFAKRYAKFCHELAKNHKIKLRPNRVSRPRQFFTAMTNSTNVTVSPRFKMPEEPEYFTVYIFPLFDDDPDDDQVHQFELGKNIVEQIFALSPRSYFGDEYEVVKVNLDDQWLAKLGDIVHTVPQTSKYLWKFDNEFRLERGKYGDADSCFYQSKQGAWIAFRESDCLVALFHDPEKPEEGIGRVIVKPNTPEPGMMTVFNGYAHGIGYRRADLTPTLKWAKALQQHFGLGIKKVGLTNTFNDKPRYFTEQVWLNGVSRSGDEERPHGYVLGTPAQIKGMDSVNVRIGSHYAAECALCNSLIPAHPRDYHYDGNCKYYCASCNQIRRYVNFLDEAQDEQIARTVNALYDRRRVIEENNRRRQNYDNLIPERSFERFAQTLEGLRQQVEQFGEALQNVVEPIVDQVQEIQEVVPVPGGVGFTQYINERIATLREQRRLPELRLTPEHGNAHGDYFMTPEVHNAWNEWERTNIPLYNYVGPTRVEVPNPLFQEFIVDEVVQFDEGNIIDEGDD